MATAPQKSASPPSPFADWRHWLLIAGIALFYFVCGRIGLSLPAAEGAVALVWPPSGIGVAAVLLFGMRIWPAVWLAALAVNWTFGLPLFVAMGVATGNTLQALIARFLLDRHDSRTATDPFSSIRHSLDFVLRAVLLASIVSATIGALATNAEQFSFLGFARTWLLWWLGDLMGVLMVAPPLLLLGQRWFWRHEQDRLQRWGRTGRIPEWGLVLAIALFISNALYGGSLPEALAARLSFVPFLLVLWAALRLSPLATVSVSLAVSICAIVGTLSGEGTAEELIRDVLFLYVFLFIQSFSALLLIAAMRERRNALLEAESARTVAQEASLQKSRFLANMSHEIRTPLNGIIGLTTLLHEDVRDAESREKLRIVRSSAESLLNVLNDIIDHARIEAGKLTITPRRFSPASLVNDVVGLFQGQTELKGIGLRARIDGSIPPFVHADDNRLRQVLVNVLSNAVKFTEKGEVLVQLLRDYSAADRLLIVVTDTGIGIPPDAVARVFEPFVQVDGSSTRRHGGAGLGLTISKQLIENMGGTLEIVSTVGTGTEISIRVPAPQLPP